MKFLYTKYYYKWFTKWWKSSLAQKIASNFFLDYYKAPEPLPEPRNSIEGVRWVLIQIRVFSLRCLLDAWLFNVLIFFCWLFLHWQNGLQQYELGIPLNEITLPTQFGDWKYSPMDAFWLLVEYRVMLIIGFGVLKHVVDVFYITLLKIDNPSFNSGLLPTELFLIFSIWWNLIVLILPIIDWGVWHFWYIPSLLLFMYIVKWFLEHNKTK